jgi:alginate O-acetyltransferase complex protein AlgJ
MLALARYFRVVDAARRRCSGESVLAVVFMACLVSPLVYGGIGGPEIFQNTANRDLAAWPTVRNVSDALAVPERLTDYYADRFGLRDVMLHWWQVLLVKGLSISSEATVVVGKDGWYYYTDDFVNDRFVGIAKRPTEQVDRAYATLKETIAQVREAGAKCYLVIAPDKESIYPEYLPGTVGGLDTGVQIRQLLDFSSEPEIEPIDVFRPLLAKRNVAPLYYRTDSHWNNWGAFVAYEAIMDRLRVEFPSLHPARRDDYWVEETQEQDRDLARLLGIPSMRDTGFSFVAKRKLCTPARRPGESAMSVYDNPEANGPTLLFVHDSFGYRLIPFLNEEFRRVIAVDLALDAYHPERVAEVRPDVVIWERVERYFVK